ncbi:MAG TPA: DNA primase [Candidatus Magasanikbacteria bacterium]|nr:DNA primase [Candidatus Magasanikbacteria bacterium]
MSDVQTIKDKIDVKQLIEEYLPMKKAGAYWKANCPFHHEKTPSFMISPEKQIWHCFGCGKGGDIFSFLQEIEGISFPEALKILADKAGVKLTQSFAAEVNKDKKNRLFEINSKAANFFYRFLLEMTPAKSAREYLEKRGVSKEMIENWQIGFIPDQWDLLTQYLLKRGFNIDDLIAAGLSLKKENNRGYFDRFRGRIMFPLSDVHGNIVGFTGRVLVETENSGGKYVNTPQTEIYDKSRVLYGLNKAKQEIKSKDLAVLVEGQMDVVACHQAGMKNVIAASGTALTEEQIVLIKRFTKNLAMAFDADSAGENAAKRGIDTAITQGMNVKVIQIPKGAGKDADECLKKNPEIWFEAVEKSKLIMEWFFERVLEKYSLQKPEEKRKAAGELLEQINKIPEKIEQDYWLQKMADKFSIQTELLRQTMRSFDKAKNSKQKSDNKLNTTEKNISELFNNRSKSLEEQLLAILMIKPGFLVDIKDKMKSDFFGFPEFRKLYEIIVNSYNNKADFGKETIMSAVMQNNERETIELLLMKGENDFGEKDIKELKEEFLKTFDEIFKEWVKNEREKIKLLLNEAQEKNDSEAMEKYFREFSELNKIKI